MKNFIKKYKNPIAVIVTLLGILIISFLMAFLLVTYISRNDGKSDRKPSYDGSYYMIETIGDYGRFVTYNIISPSNSDAKISFTTPRWFSASFFSVEGIWGLKNNDFFVLSSDIGLTFYHFNGETWTDEYQIKVYEDDNCKKIAKILIINTNPEEKEMEYDYDIGNLPQKVLDYFSQLP